MSARFLKALFAFLALPGVAAFLVPLTILRPHPPVALDPLGFLPLLLGVALLLSAVREFYVAGRGTLAPWSPPEELVTTGLYRFSRNPMYVAVVLVLFGWAAVFHSAALLVYALALALAFHLRAVFGEEPWLARTHGESWARYKSQVPRWLVRFGVVRSRERLS
jgi:protein-S-isoprenylcysteine O-methyltransferase Ste14